MITDKMAKKIKIAMAQMNPTAGDLAGNAEKIVEGIKLAEKSSANLVVFPEMAITGYCVSDLIEDDSFVEENKKVIEKIAEFTQKTAAVVGFVDYDKDKRNGDGRMLKYNAAAIMQDGKILGISHKSNLPAYKYFEDKRHFTTASKREITAIDCDGKNINLGVSICEDMWDDNYSVKPISELARKGADLIVNINASPFHPGKLAARYELAKKHIKAINKPLVYVNSVGIGDNGKNIIPFDGQSFMCDRLGNLQALAKEFEEDLVVVESDLEKAVKNPIELRKPSKEKEIFDALVASVREYGRKSGFTKAIEPVSGGIDSALGVAIAVEAFGKENVVAYNLPSKFNTSTTKSIAERLAKNLGVEYKVIPIQEIDNLVRETYEKHGRKITRQVTKENVHARIRGLLMMIESNDTGALLLSNGNKTEIALGYCTLYGDMCGGISVIGDLPKIDVYGVARYYNQLKGKEIIPKEAFTIKPSAELGEGQFDPFDYYVTSPIVEMFVEKTMNPRNLVKLFKEKKLDNNYFIKDPDGKTVYDKHTAETFEKLAYDTYSMLQRSVYKRVQGSPIIIVTDRAFGFDRRETMINRWRGR